MDARLDPAKYAGLSEGDAHVIRNAGGRASDDAIRSLVISHKLLGTQEIFVVHHTDCGMLTFTSDQLADLLRDSLATAALTPDGWRNVTEEGGSAEGAYIDFLPFADLEQSVIDDVHRLRAHPLIDPNVPIHPFVYDVTSGEIVPVAA
ncbi:MAG: carbonic anhydrase [Bifidobacteriaceae bacterium]|nr:carbonic anhydrase [Bifidobacteriaceae bacterium]